MQELDSNKRVNFMQRKMRLYTPYSTAVCLSVGERRLLMRLTVLIHTSSKLWENSCRNFLSLDWVPHLRSLFVVHTSVSHWSGFCGYLRPQIVFFHSDHLSGLRTPKCLPAAVRLHRPSLKPTFPLNIPPRHHLPPRPQVLSCTVASPMEVWMLQVQRTPGARFMGSPFYFKLVSLVKQLTWSRTTCHYLLWRTLSAQ